VKRQKVNFGNMNVIDVIIFGILKTQVPIDVLPKNVTPLTGIKRG
jgi:hypothetical protein